MTRPTNEKLAEALLASFAQDEASTESKRRAFAAFGIAASAAGIAMAAGQGAKVAHAASSTVATTTAAKTALTAGAFSMVKWLIVGAAVGAALAHASGRLATHFRDANGSPSTMAGGRAARPTTASNGGFASAGTLDAPPALSPRGSVATELPPAANEAVITAPAPSVQVRRARAATGARVSSQAEASAEAAPALTPNLAPPALVPPAQAATSSQATLSGEVVRLDRARAALRQGSLARAMRELDTYDAEFANGSLRQEASLLRIELLVDQGDEERARHLADAFATAHPRSGYLKKIRELLARSK